MSPGRGAGKARGLTALVMLALCLAGACRRRRDGTCANHSDCHPGYDCTRGVCVKRPAAPGGEGAPRARPGVVQPPGLEPEAAPPGKENLPPPPPPARPRLAPPANPRPSDDPPPPSSAPLWKLRLRDS
jgi:hypothetical protein